MAGTVSAQVIGTHLFVRNVGAEGITLTGVSTNEAGLLIEPTGMDDADVPLKPREEHEIHLSPSFSHPSYVDFVLEWIDNTGTSRRTVRVNI